MGIIKRTSSSINTCRIDDLNQELHDAVFNPNIEKGQMLGPFRTEDDTFMLLKIIGWTDKIEITESDRELLWSDVQVRLKEKKSKNVYLSWVSSLMQGKIMNLNSSLRKLILLLIESIVIFIFGGNTSLFFFRLKRICRHFFKSLANFLNSLIFLCLKNAESCIN